MVGELGTPATNDSSSIDLLAQIKDAFAGARDPNNALAIRRYMRDRFDFVGLKRSRYRNIIRPSCAWRLHKLQPVEITAVVKDLWTQLEREFQYVAIDLLIRISNYLQAADLRLIDQLLRNKAWWDSVDPFS